MDGYDFDTPIERRGTNSIKWSLGEQDGQWIPNQDGKGEPQEVNPLPMWLADMDFTTAPEIIAALRARVEHGVFGYTHTGGDFDRAVIDWETERHGWTPSPEAILLNSGIMPSINLIVQAFSEPGDGVIVQPPVFHPIAEAVEVNGRRLLRSPLVEQNGGYDMDFADLAEKASRPSTKIWILCSPHNPVGRVWTREELTRALEICHEHDVLLVSDEIHADLTHSWADFVSVGGAAGDRFENFIVCCGPSKAFNLPGLRLSLTIIPNPKIRSGFETALRNLNELWGANVLATTALVAAYSRGAPWLSELIKYLEENLEFVRQYLAERLPRVRLERPHSLYLAWIDCRQLGVGGTELTKQVHDAGLWVENGATYGAEGEGFIRLTYATPRVVLEEAMARLETALATF